MFASYRSLKTLPTSDYYEFGAFFSPPVFHFSRIVGFSAATCVCTNIEISCKFLTTSGFSSNKRSKGSNGWRYFFLFLELRFFNFTQEQIDVTHFSRQQILARFFFIQFHLSNRVYVIDPFVLSRDFTLNIHTFYASVTFHLTLMCVFSFFFLLHMFVKIQSEILGILFKV